MIRRLRGTGTDLTVDNISSRPGVVLSGGTSAAGALRHGQVLSATLVARDANGLARLDTPVGRLEAPLPGNLQTGASLRFQVQRSGSEIRLIVLTPPQAAPLHSALPSASPALNLAGALQSAVGAQNSMAPLLANLTAVMAGSGIQLPAGVHSSIEQLIGFHLPTDGSLSGEQLRAAIQNSGVFYEAKLASGMAPNGVGTDMKGVLLVLQAGLRAWLGTGPQGRLGGERPPPPVKGGGPSRAGNAALPPDLGHLPVKDLGQLLLAQAGATLSRLRLAQLASLPDRADSENVRAEKGTQQWTFELPFAAGGKSLAVQFKLFREAARKGDGVPEIWRLRFSLEPETLGPVHGSVTWQNGQVAATLWAEREDGVRVLRKDLAGLRDAMAGTAITISELQVLSGRPRDNLPSAGIVVDKMT